MNVEQSKNIKNEEFLFSREPYSVDNSAYFLFALTFLAQDYANQIMKMKNMQIDLSDNLIDTLISDFTKKLRQEIKRNIIMSY